jgi:hypothetical protein
VIHFWIILYVLRLTMSYAGLHNAINPSSPPVINSYIYVHKYTYITFQSSTDIYIYNVYPIEFIPSFNPINQHSPFHYSYNFFVFFLCIFIEYLGKVAVNAASDAAIMARVFCIRCSLLTE